MRVEEFDYPLPKSLIAQFPLEKRDCSRLLVVDRLTGELSHTYFSNITDFFKPGDLLILNDTKVIPARLKGVRETGGHVEIFLSRPVYENNFLLWESLVKPSKKVKLGMTLKLKDGLFAKVEAEKPNGIKIIRFPNNGAFFEMIEKVGEIPLPPYIHREADAIDKKRYQTVFAKEKGAVAAPTAGLHFTVELIEKIKNMGVKIEFVTLHVGIGTFLPVRRLTPVALNFSSTTSEISRSNATPKMFGSISIIEIFLSLSRSNSSANSIPRVSPGFPIE